jgi:hypothetical protein
MKCLSLRQPFATLVVIGAKRFETRSWPTTHRGPLAVHAARHFDAEARALCAREPFRSVLEAAGYRSGDDLPTGVLVGSVEVIGCRLAEELDIDPASDEAAFGDFRPGRWGWQLARAVPLVRPLRYAGRLGLFEIPFPFPISPGGPP